MQKENTAAVEYSTKLVTNHAVIPHVKMIEEFIYLGMAFDFNMDDEEHKTSLVAMCNRILAEIAKLLLHPRHKIELRWKFLKSKKLG